MADMVKFLRGLQSALPTTGQAGAFYLTTDTHRLYTAQADGTIVPVNEGVVTVANVEALKAITTAQAGDFFYAEEENILCVYNGQSFIQINKQATLAELGGVSAEDFNKKVEELIAADATTLDSAKAYTDEQIGELGQDGEGNAYANVKAYVDAKTAGIATDAALGALQDTVDGHTEALEVINGEEATAGSMKAIAKSYADGKVDKIEGYSLISDEEIERLANVDNYDDEEVRGLIGANADAIAAIAGDYVKAADIADFETKANVTKVSDELSAYKTSNDEALAGVKATAEAATTVDEVDAQIDAKITALNLGTAYEPIGAEDRAKAYVDGKFTDANLAQYTTEDEVKSIVDGVIAGAADSETYNSLTKLVDYIDTHGGEAADMAAAIETLEGDVKGLKEAPAAGIKATDIEAWNGEIGAKALAETKLDASTFTEYSNAHASDYTNKQIDDAIDADVKAASDALTAAIEAAKTDASNKDAVVLSEAQKYADQAEADAIAAAKTETQNQVKALADTVYTKEQTYTQAEVNALFTWGEF